MEKTLKQKVISGMIWNGAERFGSSFFLFLSNLVLARLLSPEDFGCIGMLMVFISLSDAIVDGGFGSALIQKKEPTSKDYSTVFYWNLTLSTCLYIILWFAAPIIARFYGISLLLDTLRVLGLMMVIRAFFLIPQNILRKQINFKKMAKINLIGVVIGTGLGLCFAYLGYGVWSLVIKSVSTVIIQCVLFWIKNHWRPQLIFSWNSFSCLFKFGGFMFLNTILKVLYSNIISLIIGKFFSAVTLGYYTQAKKLEDIPRSTLSSVINNVTYSLFSQIQGDRNRLIIVAQKCLKATVWIKFPMMLLLIVIAEPLVLVLFTEKWMPIVPYFQIFCLQGLIYSSIELNANLLLSQGKSKTFFYIQTIQYAIGLLLMTLLICRGIIWVVLGYVISTYISFILISFMTGKFLGYGFFKQLYDVGLIFILALVSAIISYVLPFILPEIDKILMLLILVLTFITTYIFLSKIFRVQELEIYYEQLISRLR